MKIIFKIYLKVLKTVKNILIFKQIFLLHKALENNFLKLVFN